MAPNSTFLPVLALNINSSTHSTLDLAYTTISWLVYAQSLLEEKTGDHGQGACSTQQHFVAPPRCRAASSILAAAIENGGSRCGVE